MKQTPMLHQTNTFWLAIFVPLLTAALIGNLIYGASTLTISLDSNDIKSLLIAFQLPIGIASLAIPLTAMVASIHRSTQTAHQIETQQAQNNFINHFKHLEEFKLAMNEDKSSGLVLWDTPEELHRSIYPNTVSGDLSPLDDVQYFPLYVETLPESLDRFSVTLLEDLRHVSRDVCRDLDANDKFLVPGEFIKLVSILKKSLRFSALHPDLLDISAETKQELGILNTIVGMVEHILEDPEARMTHLLDNGFLETFNPVNEELVDFYEESVILNSALELQTISEQEILQICQSLHTKGEERFVSILNKHIEQNKDSCHHGVIRLAKLMKGKE